ncbi:hypothetical protein GPN2_11831 [Streptomyces murinus]
MRRRTHRGGDREARRGVGRQTPSGPAPGRPSVAPDRHPARLRPDRAAARRRRGHRPADPRHPGLRHRPRPLPGRPALLDHGLPARRRPRPSAHPPRRLRRLPRGLGRRRRRPRPHPRPRPGLRRGRLRPRPAHHGPDRPRPRPQGPLGRPDLRRLRLPDRPGRRGPRLPRPLHPLHDHLHRRPGPPGHRLHHPPPAHPDHGLAQPNTKSPRPHSAGGSPHRWARTVSNRRHPACKAGALPLSYAPVSRALPRSSRQPTLPEPVHGKPERRGSGSGPGLSPPHPRQAFVVYVPTLTVDSDGSVRPGARRVPGRDGRIRAAGAVWSPTSPTERSQCVR